MDGTQFAQRILERYKQGESLESIVNELIGETEKGPVAGPVDLRSDENGVPNVRPWNILGMYLNSIKRYDLARLVWEAMLKIAFKTADKYYDGIPHVGLPYNNLAVSLSYMGKFNDAFISVVAAYTYDITIGNTGGAARPNFARAIGMLGQALVTTKEGNAVNFEKAKVIPPVVPKWVKITGAPIVLSLLTYGVVTSACYPEEWHFIIVILASLLLGLILYTRLAFSSQFLGITRPEERLEEQGKK